MVAISAAAAAAIFVAPSNKQNQMAAVTVFSFIVSALYIRRINKKTAVDRTILPEDERIAR